MSTQRRFSGCGTFLVCVGACLAVALILSALVGSSYECLATSRSGGSYTVQPGDTLSSIATRHRTTVKVLVAANGIADADQIEVGQQLKIDGKARPASARPKRSTPKPRPKPTRKRSPVEEPDALIDDHMSDVVVESLVALVRLRGYRCDSVSGAVPSVFRAGKFTLNCNQFRYAYVIEDRGGHWIVRVK